MRCYSRCVDRRFSVKAPKITALSGDEVLTARVLNDPVALVGAFVEEVSIAVKTCIVYSGEWLTFKRSKK